MPVDFRSLLLKARGVLAAIAPITPIKLDDTLVLVLDAALADAEMLGWIKGKVDAADDGRLMLEAEPPVALQSVLERRGITWAQVLSVLPALVELLRLLRG